ncbi:SWIM zinc finger family protein [candidate division TA06 bacterium]|uniref:SWIM zinc finger family protein n=1 Tax=candidate division TA06 bacterium TaxID=2250710 RepID=A0A933MKE1_UNCT6|nr:SWIM zinc finger family protein [candidate division TA06 bacterium]
MSYWRDSYYYKPTRRRPADGIKVGFKKGAVGDTWWSKRWIGVLESFNMGARLARGRSYARSGQVIKAGIEPGAAKALVQGSARQPYIVVIRLKPLSDRQWNKAIEAMSSKAVFAAKLLAGEMPQNIEESFAVAKCPLFPQSPKDLATECDCPDWANPCKHLAAVYYVLGEMFDRDPFVLFALRGRDKGRIIEELRKRRTAAAEGLAPRPNTDAATPDEPLKSLEKCLENFWKADAKISGIGFNMKPPEAPAAVIRMLGPAQFAVGSQNMTDLIVGWYDEVATAAKRRALGEGGPKKRR